MNKNKIIFSGITITAAATIAAYVAAPSFFEGQFRAYLTNSGSEVRGSFDNFQLSLFARTIAAENLSLQTAEGVTLTGDKISFENVNWLTLMGSNLFSKTLAGKITLTNGELRSEDGTARSPLPVIKDLRRVQTDAGQGLVASRLELPDFHLTDTQERVASSELVAIEDIGFDQMASISLSNLQVTDPIANVSLSVENSVISGCQTPQQFLRIFVSREKEFDVCQSASGTMVKLDLATDTTFKLSSYQFEQLSNQGAGFANLTDATFKFSNGPDLAIGSIDLRDFQHTLDPDIFEVDQETTPAQLLQIIENASLGSLTLSDITVRDSDGALDWESFMIEGFQKGKIDKLSLHDLNLDILDSPNTSNIHLGLFEITSLDLASFAKTNLITSGLLNRENPAEAMKALDAKLIGDFGVFVSPMQFQRMKMSDFSLSVTDSDDVVNAGLKEATAELSDPATFDGFNLTYAKTAQSSFDGFFVNFSEGSKLRKKIATATGLDEFAGLNLSGSTNVSWDSEAGIYRYAIDQIAFEDIGSISLSASLANFSTENMTKIMATKLNDSAKLQEFFLLESSFNDAKLEIKGKKLVEIVLNLIAQNSDQSAQDIQFVASMSLAELQQGFASFPRIANALEELTLWVNDPEHLVVELTPQNPVPIGVLASGQMAPPQIADLLQLSVRSNENAQ